MKILGHSKVKSFNRRLPCHTKTAETSNYAISAMKGPEVEFEITLASRRVNHRTLQGLRSTYNTNQQYMLIGTICEENSKVGMSIDGFF